MCPLAHVCHLRWSDSVANVPSSSMVRIFHDLKLTYFPLHPPTRSVECKCSVLGRIRHCHAAERCAAQINPHHTYSKADPCGSESKPGFPKETVSATSLNATTGNIPRCDFLPVGDMTAIRPQHPKPMGVRRLSAACTTGIAMLFAARCK